MTVLERYKLYVEDLATAMAHTISPSLFCEISEDEQLLKLNICSFQKEEPLFIYDCRNNERTNDSSEIPDDWKNYTVESSIQDAVFTCSLSSPEYIKFQTAIKIHFLKLCQTHAAAHILETTEYELVDILNESDEVFYLEELESGKIVVGTNRLHYMLEYLNCYFSIQRKDADFN